MSYEPTLIVKFDDLKKIENELFKEQYSDDNDVKRVAEYLLEDIEFEKLLPVFENTKICVMTPEFTSFNRLVRERLEQGDVYFVTNY